MAGKQPNFTPALSKWAKVWHVPSLSHRVSIAYSPRLRKSIGRARPHTGKIVLSTRCAGLPRALLFEIVCHEAAHIAVHVLHGTHAKPHGPEWRKLVQVAGYRPCTTLRNRGLAGNSAVANLSRRHHYRCPVCQEDYYTRRRNSRLVCTACHHAGAPAILRFISHSSPR